MVLSSMLLLSFISVGVCCCVMEGWVLLSPLLPVKGEEALFLSSSPPSPPCQSFCLVGV